MRRIQSSFNIPTFKLHMENNQYKLYLNQIIDPESFGEYIYRSLFTKYSLDFSISYQITNEVACFTKIKWIVSQIFVLNVYIYIKVLYIFVVYYRNTKCITIYTDNVTLITGFPHIQTRATRPPKEGACGLGCYPSSHMIFNQGTIHSLYTFLVSYKMVKNLIFVHFFAFIIGFLLSLICLVSL